MVSPSFPMATGRYMAFLIDVVSRPLLPLKDGEAGVLDWFMEENMEFTFGARPFSCSFIFNFNF